MNLIEPWLPNECCLMLILIWDHDAAIDGQSGLGHTVMIPFIIYSLSILPMNGLEIPWKNPVNEYLLQTFCSIKGSTAVSRRVCPSLLISSWDGMPFRSSTRQWRRGSVVSGGRSGAGHHQPGPPAGEADCHHSPREDALVPRLHHQRGGWAETLLRNAARRQVPVSRSFYSLCMGFYWLNYKSSRQMSWLMPPGWNVCPVCGGLI